MAVSSLRSILNFVAKMGLTLRDDPKRVIDPSARLWGEPADGIRISIESVRLREDAGVLSNLSVVLRNDSAETAKLSVPGWLFFYRIELTGPNGCAVPLTAFGRELLRPERRTERMTVTLAPGELIETQIPVGSLFDMKARGKYLAAASCELPGGAVARSNPTAIPVS